MARSTRRFAELLQEGISAVADRTSKPKGVIRDELGYAIGRKGGSAIEYWGYGDGRIPRRQADVEALARALVDAGGLDQDWLSAFLESAGYPDSPTVMTDLFPTAADELHNNLPRVPTPFVGRDVEMNEIARLIADPACRLITLVGPGGSGKSRLATEAAWQALPAFADGAHFIALAPISSAEMVTPALATSLNLTLDGNLSPQAQLLRSLRHQALLLVLDNFEHLLTAAHHPGAERSDNPAIALVNAILQEAPAVTILVTSRERLNLSGEWVYDVAGLATPAEDADTPMEHVLDGYGAPTLFVQTARRVQAGFVPTAADLAAIVRICRIVNGMPLALELAAAWVRVLTCNEIAEEIDESLGLLSTAWRDLSPRHRSMQAVFDHSWKLLNAQEQRVFAGCSVFRGGFTREAAAEVADATLPILASLVDKSLLRHNRQGRYEIHELTRQYGADRLAAAQEVVQTRHRHLRFFSHFAEEAEPRLRIGWQVAEWLDRIEREHDNLRAAIEWALNGGEIAVGMRIVGVLGQFWMVRSYAREGQAYAERFLARPEVVAHTYLYLRARVLNTAGLLAYHQGHFEAARTFLIDSIACSRQVETDGKSALIYALIAQGHTLISLEELDAVESTAREVLQLSFELQDSFAQGHAWLQLAFLDRLRGENAGAEEHFLASIECFQAIGDTGMRGTALINYGRLLYEQGDYAAAYAQVAHSLTIFEEVGDTVRRSNALQRLGAIAVAQGDYADAEAFLTQATALIRRAGQLRQLIDVLDVLGRLAQRQGDFARAQKVLQESLALSIEMNHPPWIARALEALGCLAAAQGQVEKAARLFGAADAHAVDIETRLDPVWHAEHEHWIATVRNAMGEPAFSAALAAGAADELDRALNYAAGSD